MTAGPEVSGTRTRAGQRWGLTLLALLNGRDAVLKLPNVAPQHGGLAARVQIVGCLQRRALAGGLDIQPRSEGTVSGSREHHNTHVGVGRQLPEQLAQFQPHGFEEGIELGGAVDLDVGYKGTARRDQKVLVGKVTCELRHGFCLDENAGDGGTRCVLDAVSDCPLFAVAWT